MTIFEVGRVCYKLAGRDAGKYCVVIKNIDAKYVEIDGQTRRRKCNVDHLEPLDQTVDIKEGAANKDVAVALTKAGFETKDTKKSGKKPTEKPTRQRIVTQKVADVVGKKEKESTSDKKKETKIEEKKSEEKDSKNETKKTSKKE